MKVLLLLLLTVAAVAGCTESPAPAQPAPAQPTPARPLVTDPPRDTPPRRVPFDRGFLVADDRYFEGTVGLHLVRHGREVRSWCSSGAPIRSGDLVAWVTLLCPESGDITATVLHRARIDGSHRVDQRLPRLPSTSGSVTLLRFRGDDLVYRSIDGDVWRTDLAASPRRIRDR